MGIYKQCFFLIFLFNLTFSTLVYSQTLSWSRFEPQVAIEGVTETVDVLCQPEGSFTEIRFEPAWVAGEIAMSDRGDGIYVVSLDVIDLLSNLLPSDVNRIFAGYIKLYNGATLERQYNKFLDVLTSDISNVTATILNSDVQVTPHLFNTIGTYDTPRATITQKFYEYYADKYDFINIIYDEGRHLNRHHVTVSNGVHNIGRSIFDSSSSYGSGGRLKGINIYPLPGFFDLASGTFSHETGHQWVNFLTFEPLSWRVAHWPLSTLANGIMGWAMTLGGQGLSFAYTIIQIDENQWQLNLDPNPTFTDLSLYLMGLIPYYEVGTHTIFHNQDQPIGNGEIWEGPVTYVDGYDVIAEMGERIPDYQNSQKIFRVATILATKDGLASPEMMSLYDWFASRGELEERVATHQGFAKGLSSTFYYATGGRGRVILKIGCYNDGSTCEGNFDGDEDQDGSDAFTFKVDFGRSSFQNPCTSGISCNGDFDCDGDCDGSDAFTFKEDFGRSTFFEPCPNCATDQWCVYE